MVLGAMPRGRSLRSIRLALEALSSAGGFLRSARPRSSMLAVQKIPNPV